MFATGILTEPHQTKWYHLLHRPQNVGLIGCFLFLCQVKAGCDYSQQEKGVDFIFHCFFYFPLMWNVLLYTRVMSMIVYCVNTERLFVKSASFSIQQIRQNRQQKIIALSNNYRWIERWWSWFVCYGILTIIIYTRKSMDNSCVTQSKIQLFGLRVDKITPVKYVMWAKQHLEAATDELSFLIHITRIIQPFWLLICILWWKNMVNWQGESLIHNCGRRADQATVSTVSTASTVATLGVGDDPDRNTGPHWNAYASFLKRKHLSLSFSFFIGLGQMSKVGWWWLLLSFDHLWSAMMTRED